MTTRRPSSAAGKLFSSGSRSALAMPSGFRHELILAHTDDQFRPDVRREQDDRVLEVDVAPLGVLHPPLVEDLEEQLVDVRVRFLDLVEQDDAVGPPSNRFGQDPTSP